jgi:23S rRNA (adenine2503-C2)-methyltransferase
MNSIYDYTLEELEKYFESVGEKKYRALQIFEWLYRKRVSTFEQMTNLGNLTIQHLKENFFIDDLKIRKVFSASDQTKKYLYELPDGNLIETVLMRHPYGNSVCVTSQVGCAMGCSFCASGQLGKIRNLTLSELTRQVLTVQKDLDQTNERVTNVVVMGIGEPFDNYDNLIRFLRTINYAKGLEIGARHITVSTSGLVPRIYDFANFELQVNLAISLHAPNDELRSKIMKINRSFNIESLIEAVKVYLEKTNRRVTFEYILIKNVNDNLKYAHELSDLIRGINAYVNLIPYNEVIGNPYERPSVDQMEAFYDILRKRGINATLRMEHGSEIDAACGQLRAQMMQKERKQ